MTDKAKQAKDLFESGYNCAQAVAGAWADEMGLPLETVLLLASPFGGGMGRMREVCGAVPGMLMAAGMLCGFNETNDTTGKEKIYALTQKLADKFRAENGSIICRELLRGCEVKPGTAPEERSAAYYEYRPCAGLVASAAGILEAELNMAI